MAKKKSIEISKVYWKKIDSAYSVYNKYLKPKKIGRVNPNLIKDLLKALNTPTITDTIDENYYPLINWVHNNKGTIKEYIIESKLIPKEKIDSLINKFQYQTIPELNFIDTILVQAAFFEANSFWMTSYYPTISISIFTTDKDTLYFNNSSQQTPPLPWVLYSKTSKKEYYNPGINFALFKILPLKPKINRKRLSPEHKYPIRAHPLIKYFANDIIQEYERTNNSR